MLVNRSRPAVFAIGDSRHSIRIAGVTVVWQSVMFYLRHPENQWLAADDWQAGTMLAAVGYRLKGIIQRQLKLEAVTFEAHSPASEQAR